METNFREEQLNNKPETTTADSILATLQDSRFLALRTEMTKETACRLLPVLSIETTNEDRGKEMVDNQTQDQFSLSNGELIQRLGSENHQTRQPAFADLRQRGLCALPELLAAPVTTNVEATRRVRQLIQELGATAIPYLLSATDGDNEGTRIAARQALARLELGNVLEYAYTSPAPVRQLMRVDRRLQEQLDQMIVDLTSTGSLPETEQEFRQSVAAAELVDEYPLSFHLSLASGRNLLHRGNVTAAFEPLDRCLQALADNRPGLSALHAMDLHQQLSDYINEEAQQLAPTMRQQIEHRISQALRHVEIRNPHGPRETWSRRRT